MVAPPEWLPMEGDGAAPSERNGAWLTAYATPALDADSEAHAFVSARLRATVPHARVVSVERVQHRLLWSRYSRFRDQDLKPFNEGDANEIFLFHGTGTRAASEVLASRDGLDPRFSDGGFFGHGTYLAESAAYSIGGRYAHRLSGHGGARMQLLLVRAALGAPQELGTTVNSTTKAMRMPGSRPDGVAYDSVRAGPHRPFCSGSGDGGDGDDASVVYVLYRSDQM